MSIYDNEALSQQLDSLETYTFTTALTTYRWTTYKEDVTIGEDVYTSIPGLRRSGFTRDFAQGLTRCNIVAPITSFFAQYIVATPVVPTQITIRKYYMDDYNEYINVFVGLIYSISIKDFMCQVECLSSTYELRRRLPHNFIQGGCNNTLYDAACTLDENNWRVITTAVLVPGYPNLLSSVNFDVGVDYYKLGRVVYDYDERFVVNHSGEIIELQFPFIGFEDGNMVSAYAGCNKEPSVCLEKFSNIDNFFGFPYMKLGPNPVNWGVD